MTEEKYQKTPAPQEVFKSGETFVELTGLTAGIAIGGFTGSKFGADVGEMVKMMGEIGYSGVSFTPTKPIVRTLLGTDPEQQRAAKTLIEHSHAIGRSWVGDTARPEEWSTYPRFLIATLTGRVEPVDIFIFSTYPKEREAMRVAMRALSAGGRPFFYQTHNEEEALDYSERFLSDGINARVALELHPENYQEAMRVLDEARLKGLPVGLALDTRHAREALRDLETTVSYPHEPTKSGRYNEPYLAELETILGATSLIHLQGTWHGAPPILKDTSELWQTVTGDKSTDLYRFVNAVKEAGGSHNTGQLPVCVEHSFAVWGQMQPGAKGAVEQAKRVLNWAENNLR